MRFAVKPVASAYWLPGTMPTDIIPKLVEGDVQEGDTVVLSEKALSVALGRIADESVIIPSFMARLLTRFWMRIVWGYFLSVLCRLSRKNTLCLRNYPISEGSRHKQLVLSRGGFLKALRHGSEAGIDASNLPYALVSLPIENPTKLCGSISKAVLSATGKRVNVLIVDSDKTYSFRSLYLAARSTQVQGIHSAGLFAYIAGRFLKLRARSTPLGFYGETQTPDMLLQMAAAANKIRGSGAGRTAWEMSEHFGTAITGVTWEMLRSIAHYPIVLIRPLSNVGRSPSKEGSDVKLVNPRPQAVTDGSR